MLTVVYKGESNYFFKKGNMYNAEWNSSGQLMGNDEHSKILKYSYADSKYDMEWFNDNFRIISNQEDDNMKTVTKEYKQSLQEKIDALQRELDSLKVEEEFEEFKYTAENLPNFFKFDHCDGDELGVLAIKHNDVVHTVWRNKTTSRSAKSCAEFLNEGIWILID